LALAPLSATCSPGLLYRPYPCPLYWFSMWPTLPPCCYIAGCFRLVAQSAATCWRWFLARGFFYPEDGKIRSSGTSVHTRSTQCHIAEDGIFHGIEVVLFSGTQRCVFRWKWTDVSEDHVASIFEGRGISHVCMLPALRWFLVSRTLRPWKWRRCVPPERPLNFTGLDGLLQKIEFRITISVRTTVPTSSILKVFWIIFLLLSLMSKIVSVKRIYLI
jgi:hypothetical protein